MALVKRHTDYKEYTDPRGSILEILSNVGHDGPDCKPIESVLLIRSVKGSIRANHVHKEDTHWCLVLEGKMRYVEQTGFAVDDAAPAFEEYILEEGDMVFTPAGNPHAMEFLEDTTFIAMATMRRDQESYEADTTPVKLI